MDIKNMCRPAIAYDTMMADDGDFMDTATINKKCQCIHKTTCLAIAKLLEEDKLFEAVDKIKTIR